MAKDRSWVCVLRRCGWEWALAAMSLTLASTAVAAEREHGAHAHGIGQLDLAIEGQTVEMTLIMPGADVVGFEHAATTADEKAAVAAAVVALNDAVALFGFPAAAGCRLAAASVESSLIEDSHGDHDDHAADKRHGEAAEEPGDGHAEFEAHYRFDCTRPDRLGYVDVGVFARFPAARALAVRTIAPWRQGAQELTPASSRLKF